MMDKFSCNSSAQKLGPFDHDDQEESGWTAYLEDFSNHHYTSIDDRDQDTSSCSILGDASPSLVSDAATGAAVAWRRSHPMAAGCSPVSGSVSFPNKLKFRKARTKQICEDDPLEDTASSPVNSPKVSHLEQIQATPKIDDYISSGFAMGNGRVPDQIHEGDEGSMKNVKDGRNDLRSRGLRLVPISMLVNYNS